MRRWAGLLVIACSTLVAGGCDLVFGPDLAGPLDADPDRADADLADGRYDGPPGDTDGDTILDGDDNCRFDPNVSQRDDDHDGIGDVCDDCIGISNVDQLDGDGDHIGDACDLFPAAGGTTIVTKFYVDGGATPDNLLVGSGTWAGDLDGLNQLDSGHADADIMLDTVMPATGYLWIEVGVTIGTTSSGTTAVGTWTDADTTVATPGNGHFCQIGRSGGMTRLELIERISSTDGNVGLVTAAQGLQDGSYLQFVALRDTVDGYRCHELPAGGDFSHSHTSANGGRRFGLHTSFTSARFEYIIIYRHPS